VAAGLDSQGFRGLIFKLTGRENPVHVPRRRYAARCLRSPRFDRRRGNGEVYKAKDTPLNRTVAIRFFPRVPRADIERLARFEREARTLAALNIIPTSPKFTVSKRAMGSRRSLWSRRRHVAGIDRTRARDRCQLTRRCKIAKQIAEALESGSRAAPLFIEI
jgi:serine/threonine protein kinase